MTSCSSPRQKLQTFQPNCCGTQPRSRYRLQWKTECPSSEVGNASLALRLLRRSRLRRSVMPEEPGAARRVVYHGGVLALSKAAHKHSRVRNEDYSGATTNAPRQPTEARQALPPRPAAYTRRGGGAEFVIESGAAPSNLCVRTI